MPIFSREHVSVLVPALLAIRWNVRFWFALCYSLPVGAVANTKGLYVALRKGVAVRDRRVYWLQGRVRRLCPWLAASDGPTIRVWCEIEILATVLFGRLRDEGLLTPAGEPLKLLSEYRALRAAQLTVARELGLTPSARRALAGKGLDLAAEFAALNGEQAQPTDVTS